MDTLTFSPGALSDGDTVRVSFISAADEAGNDTTLDISTWYVIDTSPPYLSSALPGDGDIVADPSPTIMLDIEDDIAGVDPFSIVVWLNGVSVSFEWDGDVAWVFCDSLGITFDDGDTVRVCVSASDAPDFCAPNVMSDTCFEFTINLAGPLASIIEPLPNTYVACDSGEQRILLLITDPDGVDETTISFVVDGDTLTVSSPNLSYEGDTLTFTPATPWLDAVSYTHLTLPTKA